MAVWDIPEDLAKGIANWQSEWASGREGVAREMAEQLVTEHPTPFAHLAGIPQEHLVKIIDACRGERPWADKVIQKYPEREPLVNVFIMGTFPPQHIVGHSNLGAAGPELLRAMADALERGE